MTVQTLATLAWQSVVAPRDVARQLIGARLDHGTLLLIFALVVVLNAIVSLITVMIAPPDRVPLAFESSPVIFMLMIGGMLAVMAIAVTWTGRAIGGTGRLEDIGLLILWLQGLWIGVQGGVAVLLALGQGGTGALLLAAYIVQAWMLVNFLDVAHGFENRMRAVLVLVLGTLGMALGLTLFLTLIGVSTLGMN